MIAWVSVGKMIRHRTVSDGRFELEFAVTACSRVPVSIESGLWRDGEISGVVAVPGIQEAFLLEKSTGRYKLEGQSIEFGAGRPEHGYLQVRGGLPKLEALSVSLTGFTLFHWRISIR